MKKNLLLITAVFSIFTSEAQTKKPTVKTGAKPVAAPVFKNATDSFSYALGYNMANFYKQQGVKRFNPVFMNKAINDAFKTGAKPLLTEEQMNTVMTSEMQKLKQQKPKSGEEIANRKAGETFLNENKTKDSVMTTASGLQYKIIKAGTGPKPALSDQVRCHYHGTLINGTVFDSSVDRNEPAVFPVGGVIQGWVEALQLMPVGSKWRLFVPADLAYGSQQAGPSIGPGSTLIFDVELLEIVK
jgi:FKBP-type peptidyl-prolyl cis-trans isomerase FklB